MKLLNEDSCYYYYVKNNNKQILGFDLDSTIIKTKSGAKFPNDAEDWVFQYPSVKEKLISIKDKFNIIIFSNQKGLNNKPKINEFNQKNELRKILDKFIPLFNNSSITWIGQNLKYDLLILKNIGIELSGNIFDTMLAHYVIEPEGKRSMDILSAKYLGYETVKITELIGKKGKNQGNMRDVEVEKIKEYA